MRTRIVTMALASTILVGGGTAGVIAAGGDSDGGLAAKSQYVPGNPDGPGNGNGNNGNGNGNNGNGNNGNQGGGGPGGGGPGGGGPGGGGPGGGVPGGVDPNPPCPPVGPICFERIIAEAGRTRVVAIFTIPPTCNTVQASDFEVRINGSVVRVERIRCVRPTDRVPPSRRIRLILESAPADGSLVEVTLTGIVRDEAGDVARYPITRSDVP